MSACIKCGGTDDLKDRGMAPGMTYCAPCRRAMSEGTGPSHKAAYQPSRYPVIEGTHRSERGVHLFAPGQDMDDPDHPDDRWCNTCGEAVAGSKRQPTVSEAWLLRRFLRRGLRGFRVLRSAEAPLIRYRRNR